MKKILKYAVHIHLDNIHKTEIVKGINNIIESENVNILKNALNKLIDYINNDIRLLVNLLQELHYNNLNEKINIKKIEKFKNIYSKKNKIYTIKNSISDLLTNDLTIEESYNIFSNDHNIIPYYIYDNSILYIKNIKIKENDKFDLYNKILDCVVDYNYYDNNSLNYLWLYDKYSTIFCSYELNQLTKKYK